MGNATVRVRAGEKQNNLTSGVVDEHERVMLRDGRCFDVNLSKECHSSDISIKFDCQNSPTGVERIDPEVLFLHRYGIGLPMLIAATDAALQSRLTTSEELIRAGVLSKTAFGMICADHQGVEFSREGPDPELLTRHSKNLGKNSPDLQAAKPGGDFSNIVTEFQDWHERPKIYLACDPKAIPAISNLVTRSKIQNSQIALTTQKTLHHAQFVSQQSTHLANAIDGLEKQNQVFSASRVVTGWQVLVLVVALVCALLGLLFWPANFLLNFYVFATFFYFSVTLMRAAMIVKGADIIEETSSEIALFHGKDSELPTYTILVALYKEANQVADLISSLSEINWPADRLQILLICEADDIDTIELCEKFGTDERFQTVICPVAQPRTKPKALNFALPLAKGKFLVLYDAEDRPHKNQLREAYAKFEREADVVCLQAPLHISNAEQSWFTRLFAIEYLTQFSLMWRVLERWQCPIPLGGTSNHFRTEILKFIGAWDPYNVTEDADLGIRLSRFGYRCGTLKLPTLEEAPPGFAVWLPQRTRWLKGWIQTLLVHTRRPIVTARELGLKNVLFFHLLITAIVVSFLIHPFFIATTIYHGIMLMNGMRLDGVTAIIIGVGIFNLAGAYSTYAAVVWLALRDQKKMSLFRSIVWMPVYWLLISIAGWRALAQLFFNPFVWEKTQHGLANNSN